MKPLTLEEIYSELNNLLTSEKLFEEPLDFENITVSDALSQIYKATHLLEYRFYQKRRKTKAVPLRKIHTLCIKLLQHENKHILNFRKSELD
jgi:hypothetical protein